MEDDDRKLDVTIIRPRTDGIPREVGIGLSMVAKLIAARIRKEYGIAQVTEDDRAGGLELLDLGGKS